MDMLYSPAIPEDAWQPIMGDFSNRMSGDVNMDTVGLVLVAS
jgi:hypothetical protein